MNETPVPKKMGELTTGKKNSMQAGAGSTQSKVQQGATIRPVYLHTDVQTVSVPVSTIRRHLNGSLPVSLLTRFSEFLFFGSIPIGLENYVTNGQNLGQPLVFGSMIVGFLGLVLWFLSYRIMGDLGSELKSYVDDAKEDAI